MMWDYGWGQNMMGAGWGSLVFLTWLVVFVDGVLAGIWLWKQITKKG